MIHLTFEPHSTCFDNEAHKSSGWNDNELSELGIERAKEWVERYKDNAPDAIFCSDLSRAYTTANIAFNGSADKTNPSLIFMDWRLRECNYGDMTQHPSAEVDAEKINRINKPFPNGESYMQTAARMKSFLEDLLKFYDGKRVVVIGHRATQFAIEHYINGKKYEELTTTEFVYQPGWDYDFDKLLDNGYD